MPETPTDLRKRLQEATRPGILGRLLDRGLARGMIWREGVVPRGGPPFSANLTQNLLDYAHTIIATALRLRAVESGTPLLERAFLTAGAAIEAAVHRDAVRNDTGFHRVSCAAAFHLARYSARAYSILPPPDGISNLSPTETVLVHLIRRKFDEMAGVFSTWLTSEANGDEEIARRLGESGEFGVDDACDRVMTSAFMRGIALFDHAIVTGGRSWMDQSDQQLRTLVEAAADLNAVNHWWTATLALHLLRDLWEVSLHNTIPADVSDRDNAGWKILRRRYIQRLRQGAKAAVELWPSQIQAAQRAIEPSDNLVVALPTGAGKTRVAELCILRAIAKERRVVYVTPLRALSAQIERDLANTFVPLGCSVSALYGSAPLAWIMHEEPILGETQEPPCGTNVVPTTF